MSTSSSISSRSTSSTTSATNSPTSLPAAIREPEPARELPPRRCARTPSRSSMRSRAESPTSLPTTSGSTTSTRQGGRAAILGPIERYNELTGEDGRGRARARGRGARPGRGGRGRRRAMPAAGASRRTRTGSRPRTCSSCSSGCGRSSANGARPFSASQRSGSWEGPSRSCERISSGRSGACSRQSRTLPPRCSTTSSRRRARRSRTARAISRSTPRSESPRSVPVLDALGRERIVRAVDGAGGGERYEIFHDVLADGVLAWRARRVHRARSRGSAPSGSAASSHSR